MVKGRTARRYTSPFRLFLYIVSRNMFIATGIVLILMVMQQNVDLSPSDVQTVWNQ